MTDLEKAIEEAKADMMPFESWEQLPGESSLAFLAFCAFRDCGMERSVRKAVESAKHKGKYNVWRNWCTQYRWRERAAEYDRHLEKLKQEELRKTIEAQGEMHRAVTGKMLEVVKKKLDLMDPSELTQNNVPVWAESAIKAERESAGLANSGKPEPKQGELFFTPEFQGL